MNTPITAEYALERLEEALRKHDREEVEKWDMILRSENDYRLKIRQRNREHYERLMQIKLKESYKLP